MSSSTNTLLAAAFRAAAGALEPAARAGSPVTPGQVEAWLTIEAIRGQTRWMDATIAAAQPGALLAEASKAEWLLAWCRAWVSRAAPAFRKHADRLAPSLGTEPSSVAPLLAYWRITGRRRWLDSALDALPAEAVPGDLVAAEAFRQAWRATAGDEFRARACSCYDDPRALPLAALPGAAELLGRDWLDEDLLDPLLDSASPEDTVQAAAALGLPLLRVTVQWWLETELREGPVAEAATFPWPALELSFERLDERDQVRFVPEFDGRAFEPIVDAGVVGAGLTEILREADRSLFLEAAGARRRSLLRR